MSCQRFELCFESFPEPLFFLERDRTFGTVNAAWSSLTGLSKEQLLGRSFQSVVGEPTYSDTLQPCLDRAMAGEQSTCVVSWPPDQPGETYVRITFIPAADTNGQPAGGRGSNSPTTARASAVQGRDIPAGVMVHCRRLSEATAEEIEANRKLQEERKQFQRILDGIPENVYVMDLETYRIVYANTALKQQIGSDPTGHKCYEVLHAKDEICEFCKNDELKPDGSSVCWEVYAPETDRHYYNIDQLIYSPDGRPQKLQLALDITAVKQIEASLRVNEQRYRFLADNAADAIWTMDQHYTFTYASPSTTDILGYEPEELIGQSFAGLLPEQSLAKINDFATKRLQSVRAGEPDRSTNYVEVEIFTKNGDRRWLETSTSPVFDREDRFQGIVGISRDITEKRRYQDLKEEVDRILRHDLRSPLNGIVGIPGVLKNEANLDDEQRELLAAVESLGQRMVRMIDASRLLFRIERGDYEYYPQAVNIVSTISQVLAQEQELFTAAGVRHVVTVHGMEQNVAAHPADADAIVVEGDDLLVREILSKLVTNAVEASPADCPVLIDISSTPGTVTVKIRNTGTVPQAIRDSFFQKFCSHGKTNKAGLGTYIAKQMADAMGYGLQMTANDESDETEVEITIPSASQEPV